MRESQIEKYLVERVTALGGEVRKVKWIGRRGAPDRLVMLPIPDEQEGLAVFARALAGTGLSREAEEFLQRIAAALETLMPPLWVELKAPGEKCRPHQIREHERMRRMGQRVIVIDSLEGVDEVLS